MEAIQKAEEIIHYIARTPLYQDMRDARWLYNPLFLSDVPPCSIILSAIDADKSMLENNSCYRELALTHIDIIKSILVQLPAANRPNL